MGLFFFQIIIIKLIEKSNLMSMYYVPQFLPFTLTRDQNNIKISVFNNKYNWVHDRTDSEIQAL